MVHEPPVLNGDAAMRPGASRSLHRRHRGVMAAASHEVAEAGRYTSVIESHDKAEYDPAQDAIRRGRFVSASVVYLTDSAHDLDDLPDQLRSGIGHFFAVHRDLGPGRGSRVNGWDDRAAAATFASARRQFQEAR